MSLTKLEQDKLVVNNIDFAHKLASLFMKKNTVLDIDDVRQEAVLAMISAAKTYDSSRSSFTTFAHLVINRRLIDYRRKFDRINRDILNGYNFDSSFDVVVREYHEKDIDSSDFSGRIEKYQNLQLWVSGKTQTEIGAIFKVDGSTISRRMGKELTLLANELGVDKEFITANLQLKKPNNRRTRKLSV